LIVPLTIYVHLQLSSKASGLKRKHVESSEDEERESELEDEVSDHSLCVFCVVSWITTD
jgi:hypothetical protein